MNYKTQIIKEMQIRRQNILNTRWIRCGLPEKLKANSLQAAAIQEIDEKEKAEYRRMAVLHYKANLMCLTANAAGQSLRPFTNCELQAHAKHFTDKHYPGWQTSYPLSAIEIHQKMRDQQCQSLASIQNWTCD